MKICKKDDVIPFLRPNIVLTVSVVDYIPMLSRRVRSLNHYVMTLRRYEFIAYYYETGRNAFGARWMILIYMHCRRTLLYITRARTCAGTKCLYTYTRLSPRIPRETLRRRRISDKNLAYEKGERSWRTKVPPRVELQRGTCACIYIYVCIYTLHVYKWEKYDTSEGWRSRGLGCPAAGFIVIIITTRATTATDDRLV